MNSALLSAPDRPADQSCTRTPTPCGEPAQQCSQSPGYLREIEGPVTETSVGNAKENESPHGSGSVSGPVAEDVNKDDRVDGLDDFGLPIRVRPRPERQPNAISENHEVFHDVEKIGAGIDRETELNIQENSQIDSSKLDSQDRSSEEQIPIKQNRKVTKETVEDKPEGGEKQVFSSTSASREIEPSPPIHLSVPSHDMETSSSIEIPNQEIDKDSKESVEKEHDPADHTEPSVVERKSVKASEFSHQGLHQRLAEGQDSEQHREEESDGGWQDMPALGDMDHYDDFGRLVAKGSKGEEDDEAVYRGLGGAGRGYTRVQVDDDAQSATSLDEDTSYLFKETQNNSVGVDDELRDATSQLQATKDLLTESQRIAYVGVTRLTVYRMSSELQRMPSTKGSRKAIHMAQDSVKKWGQMMMGRLYAHMEINPAEQIMIEQLAEHGVQASDLVRPLMQNARVKNPVADDIDTPRESISSVASPSPKKGQNSVSAEISNSEPEEAPPPYDAHESGYVPEVHTEAQSHLPASKSIDIDLRWTVLCDLFLVLIADSAYDSRSRTLIKRFGEVMDVSPMQICRFEKRVIDALEMQEATSKETWDESEHMENRRKMALKKKYMVMGLATVGGGVVIGLSAGLLAPVIGAGLAAGFTTVGISGTSAFLGGAGGTALIASSATLTGGTIGMRASHKRTGAVQTFEYRPLHNNRRFNLIVTVAGWMAGGLDDIRLPYSTVDPIMGDLYSVLWEPEMLQSMGDTINLLATEALAAGLQQVLGNTVLVALMASLQLPLVLTKLSYLIDNPWNVSLTRANAAGLILADSLIDQNLGKRPVTLLGFSLGSRVIFACLKELAEKGAFGLVEDVYLFGSPIVANKDDYLKARSAVSGTFVNGFSRNDWILGYLFRATSGGIMRVAGLAPVDGIPRLDNVDCTDLVNGHMDYRTAMPRLLREVGWEVLSDEFEEIVEDPDPDNHAERQRELIREIDAARKEAELKPEKKRFGLFKRKKLAKKKPWETYDLHNSSSNNPSSRESGDSSNGAGTVLFDTDAIRAELASENIQVKQLESTLPPMKLDLNSSSGQSSAHPSPSSSKHAKDPSATADEGVLLNFDAPVEAPQRSYSSSLLQRTPEPFPEPEPEPVRPALMSSLSTPATVGRGSVAASTLGAAALEHNAWADDDDGEIQLAFE